MSHCGYLWAALVLGILWGILPKSLQAQDTTAAMVEPEGNQLFFTDTTLTVGTGETVKLTFNNTATSEAMKHNVVLLDTMADSVITRVGRAATRVGADEEYIPDDPAILAHTPLANPGQVVEVTFTAPEEPGKYRYTCTFPGHYVQMKGTMIVEDEVPE